MLSKRYRTPVEFLLSTGPQAKNPTDNGIDPQPMHDIANRDSRSEKQPSHSTNKENGNADYLSFPSMS
jgi:hypothetical protein